MNDYATQLRKNEGLFLSGVGGGMINNIDLISMTFVCCRKTSIDEARNLYVQVMQGYLQRINRDEEIRPYLVQYPFTWDNIDLHFLFQETTNQFSSEGVATIFQGKRGEIVYHGYDGKKLYPLYRETREQAIDLANIAN